MSYNIGHGKPSYCLAHNPFREDQEGEGEGRVKETEDEEVHLDEEWLQIREEVEEEETTRSLETVVLPSPSQTPTEATHIETSQPMLSGQDASSQLARSTISQQMVVSSSHGDQAQLPLTAHLELVGVEIREELPHLSTSFSAHRVLEPLPGIFSIPSILRTRSGLSQAVILRDSA